MDKNMINIDDLFRQRLGGGEEEERSGAWLQMRGLLDEKMPVGVVNWRRMLMFTGGLALLAAVSITGYEVSSSTRNLADASINTANNSTDKQSAITINSNKVLSGNNQPATKTTTSANNNSSSNNNNNNTYNVTAVAPVANNTTSNGNANTPTANNSSTNEQKNNTVVVNNNITQPVANTTVTTNNNNGTVASVNPDNKGKNKEQKHTTTPKHVVAKGIIPAGSHVVNNNNVTQKQHPVTTTPPVANSTVKKNHNNTVSKDNIIPGSGNKATSNTTNVATNTNGTSDHKKNNSTVYDLKDSIDRLVVKQHYIVDPVTRTATYRVDTVAISKMPHFIIAAPADKEVVVADKKKHQKNNVSGLAKKQKTNSSNDVLLEAKLNESKTGAIADNAATTTTAKVVTKHNKAGWDWSVLGQALRDFEYNLGRVKVYPGLIGGINKTFGNYSNSGFQFGMTTEFVVNDQMSVMAEFKYMQRFSGGTINYNYSTSNPPVYNGFEWVVTTNNYQNSFRYSTINSIEMPIALRYKTGNFFIYAGGNLVYNFAMDVTDGLPQSQGSEISYYPTTSNWKPVKNKLTIDDFNSRFGLGYLLGTSYEFTPSIMLDGRLTKTFWDNAHTDGAKQISDLMFKGPSVQLSIIYRLNHQRPETVSPRY